MVAVALGALGGAMGTAALGSIGAGIGYLVGSTIGSAVDRAIFPGQEISYKGPRLADLSVQSSAYGKIINIIYGECRVAGNVIWSLPIKEHENVTETEVGGGKGGGGNTVRTSQYYYTATLAIAICQGEIEQIKAIWADSKLLAESEKLNIRIYPGTKDQMPDPLIESCMGYGKTPAYRGLAYVVIENFPLADYGNRIPNFTFQVKARAGSDSADDERAENLVKAVCIIPGSGEYVYDTQVQNKLKETTLEGKKIAVGKSVPINQNNYEMLPDAVLSTKQLMTTCKNLQWVAPVVGWFTDDLDIKNCKIKPCVESRLIKTQDNHWQVGNYNRNNAGLIITDENNRPIYGGTTADGAILNYLQYLKKQGLKIMFYPMFFLNKPDKPWRGHISGLPEDVEEFFNQEQGYNNFILHYANLTKGLVDAFIIGSELKKITSITDGKGNFPAVGELVKLARKVKEILGENVKITYAADWSEYHHTEGGWHHLDPLWADDAIDVIGIDAYFPLTCQGYSEYDEELIMQAWESGEGFDYYFENSQAKTNKQQMSAKYAWKNIKWWWENEHINPDSKKTAWKPKQKKIWFTEYGFPSVNCATNQPNIFYDPKAYDGGVPIFSNSMPDFLAQRKAVSATEKKWANSEMVERMFLWAWDARPFPYWPRYKSVWADGEKWSRGHSINGKFGLSTLAEIVYDLCVKAGFTDSEIDVTLLKDFVDGFIINDDITPRQALELLANCYDFEIIEAQGKLKFKPAKLLDNYEIDKNDLILLDGKNKLIINKVQMSELPKTLMVSFLDKNLNFQPNVVYADYHLSRLNEKQFSYNFGIVLNKDNAQKIAENMLEKFHEQKFTYHIKLPSKYCHIEVGSKLEINLSEGKEISFKVTSINYDLGKTLDIRGVSVEKTDFINQNTYLESQILDDKPNFITNPDLQAFILDIPPAIKANKKDPQLMIAVTSRTNSFRPAHIYYSVDNQNFKYLSTVNNEAIAGKAIFKNLNSKPYFSTIDVQTKIQVILTSGKLKSVSYDDLISGANIAIVENELIQFQHAKLISENIYEISGLIRGAGGSEINSITDESKTYDFILLNQNLKRIKIPKFLVGREFFYKILVDGQYLDDVESKNFVFNATSLKPLAPVNIKLTNQILSWQRRNLTDGLWLDFGDIPTDENKERYYLKLENQDGSFAEFYSDSTNFKLEKPIKNAYICQISEIVGSGFFAKI